LIILHADPARGGAERYTIDLAVALVKAGHEVSLLASSFAEVPTGVTRVELPAGGLTRTRRYRAFLDSLAAHLDQANYDIVHAMLPVRRCDVYHPHAGLAVAAVRQKPLGAIFNPRRGAFTTVERELLDGSRPPIVIALSQYVKRAIEQFYPSLGDRLAVLFNAVDIDHFQPQPHALRDEVHALFVGKDAERKGLNEAEAAVIALGDRRLKLIVVGADPPSSYIPRHVQYIGNVADAKPHYADADFFVLPTKHDPCSLVVLEALTMGLPVISTRFNGACEIMTDGVHGYVLDDPKDWRTLADRIKRLLDPELRARMSAACLELRPKLAYEHHLSTLLAIYSRIIAGRQQHV
jgi:UDP-glucose:(heptosyl)LPS alpha-1,3-glucosyltransferase